MAVTLREQILLNIASAMEGITTANGYETDVELVLTEPIGATEAQCTTINVIDRGDSSRRMLLFCNEHRMTVELQGMTKESAPTMRVQKNQRLLGDMKKRIHAQLDEDETWGELAVSSTLMTGGSSPWDQSSPVNAQSVVIEVLYRDREGNPSVQQVI